MATAKINIAAHIEIEDWDPDLMALAKHMATDPGLQSHVIKVAEMVETQAKLKMTKSGLKAPKSTVYVPYGTTSSGAPAYWSASPLAVAKMISIKDSKTTFPRTRAFQFPIFVSLVVASHPYSSIYEYGGLGITANKFMRRAANAVVGRNPGLKRKGGLGRVQ